MQILMSGFTQGIERILDIFKARLKKKKGGGLKKVSIGLREVWQLQCAGCMNKKELLK